MSRRLLSGTKNYYIIITDLLYDDTFVTEDFILEIISRMSMQNFPFREQWLIRFQFSFWKMSTSETSMVIPMSSFTHIRTSSLLVWYLNWQNTAFDEVRIGVPFRPSRDYLSSTKNCKDNTLPTSLQSAVQILVSRHIIYKEIATVNHGELLD